MKNQNIILQTKPIEIVQERNILKTQNSSIQ